MIVIAIGVIAGFASMIRVAGIAVIIAAVLTFLHRKNFVAASIIFFLGFAPLGLWSAQFFKTPRIAPEEHSNYIANNYLVAIQSNPLPGILFSVPRHPAEFSRTVATTRAGPTGRRRLAVGGWPLSRS